MVASMPIFLRKTDRLALAGEEMGAGRESSDL